MKISLLTDAPKHNLMYLSAWYKKANYTVIKIRSYLCFYLVYVGFDTTEEEDLHRCQVIDDYGLTPYPMPFVRNDYTRRFKRFINLHYYRQYQTVEAAWKDYNR